MVNIGLYPHAIAATSSLELRLLDGVEGGE